MKKKAGQSFYGVEIRGRKYKKDLLISEAMIDCSKYLKQGIGRKVLRAIKEIRRADNTSH